jgi:putative oxidoreductase
MFAVMTYLEDASRCFMMWEDQLGYVANHTGLPSAVASATLLLVTLGQCASVLLIAPPVLVPKLARPIIGLSIVVAVSVCLQPFLFNQLSNFELLTMSAAQLGALGLILGEAHAVAYPRKKPFAAFCMPMGGSGDATESAAVVAWIQLLSRLLLTVDLVCVFGKGLIESVLDESSGGGAMGHAGLNVMLNLFILLAGVMVWLGFQTELCASIVAICALFDAGTRFPFWTSKANVRDHYKFHFFQECAAVGGLLLLAANGPGKLSVDGKAKTK